MENPSKNSIKVPVYEGRQTLVEAPQKSWRLFGLSPEDDCSDEGNPVAVDIKVEDTGEVTLDINVSAPNQTTPEYEVTEQATPIPTNTEVAGDTAPSTADCCIIL